MTSAGEWAVDPRALQVGVAVDLAAHFFGRRREDGTRFVRLKDVTFVLSGQVGAWSDWSRLDSADQLRLARLWRYRDPDLVVESVARKVLQRSASYSLPGVRVPESGYFTEVVVTSGRPPLDLADEGLALLAQERSFRSTRQRPTADAGEFVSTLYRDGGAGLPIEIHYSVATLPESEETVPLDIGDPAVAETLEIPIADLRRLASHLDEARGESYRTQSLNRIFDNLERTCGRVDPDGVWCLTAGLLQVLHAPTGFGKSVLTELVACWCAERGRVMTILVPTNSSVIKTAHSITKHLSTLGLSGEAVPLTSPRGAQKAAETAVLGDPSTVAVGQWAMRKMAYGCALASAATPARTDTWEPGAEPCNGLRPAAEERGRNHRCPWFATCGKFRTIRRACSAPVVVTSYFNWLQGIVQIPVSVDGVVDESMPVQQLLLHRSHLVLIDEVDEFQATMIKKSAGSILLAHEGAMPTTLDRISIELEHNRRRLGPIRGDARSSASLARELADRYVGHLANGSFQSLELFRRGAHPLLGRWILARRWDAQMAAVLFDVPDGEELSDEIWGMFRDLYGEQIADEHMGVAASRLPQWLLPVREALHSLQINDGFDPHQDARGRITEALIAHGSGRLSEDRLRDITADRLIRRAYLIRLTELLTSFIYLAPHLHAAGVSSAREIADKLRHFQAWQAAPLGPLGRTLFAFSENHDPDRPHETSLSVNAFGGDPHEYVRAVGETTALALLGHRRCVVGLSATSFFPGAPHHHVFATPAWWVADSVTGGIDLAAAPVSDEEQQFLRISGTSGQQRRKELQRLGRLLWTKHLAAELEHLAADPKTRRRQRILLATTSYEGAEDLAHGISRASGIGADKLVVAVPPDVTSSRAPSGDWIELPGDQLEQFGREVDGTVLIAPLARAARGINLADASTNESLVGSIWLVVRPVPIIDEPAEILAHVHASTKTVLPATSEPADTLDMVRHSAKSKFDEMFNALPYFTTLPREVRLGIAAETLVGLIQLAGRGRRGGTTARIRLVDYAFFDDRGNAGLPRLIEELRATWASAFPNDHLELIERLYGETIAEIFDFARRERQTTNADPGGEVIPPGAAPTDFDPHAENHDFEEDADDDTW